MNRVHWVDNTKTFAFYLVVLGHFSGLGSTLKNFIYSFHLPIFLLISGFLIANKLSKLNVKELFNTQLNYLLKLYIFFSIISIFLFIFGQFVSDQSYDAIGLILGSLYGVHGIERWLGHSNGALWYFPFFIVSVLIFFFVIKLPTVFMWVVGILLALFSVTYQGIRLPWALDIAGVGVFFLLLGRALKLHYDQVKTMFYSKMSLFCLPVAVLLLVYTTGINGNANINRVIFGNNSFLFFMNAIIGCWIVIAIAHHIKYFKVIELVSKNTLFIFCAHLYFVKSLGFLQSIDSRLIKLVLIVLISFIITFICMQLSRFVMPFLNKLLLNKGAS